VQQSLLAQRFFFAGVVRSPQAQVIKRRRLIQA